MVCGISGQGDREGSYAIVWFEVGFVVDLLAFAG